MAKIDQLAQASKDRAGESLGKNRTRVDRPEAAARGPAGGAKFAGVTRLMNVAAIEVARIVRDEDQPREEFDRASLERLADSMVSKGQLQPVRVRWDETRGSYVILAGERRWRAAQLAGMPTIAAAIHEGEVTPAERLVLQLVENCIREDLKPIEQARAFRSLMVQNGWTTTRVGEELGINQGTVVKALKLLELPEPVQDRVEQGELSPASAYEISKVRDPGAQLALAEKAVAENLTRDEVSRGRRAGTKPPTRRSRVAFHCGEDTVIVEGPSAAAGADAVLMVIRAATLQAEDQARRVE